jgi:hypothetical protein
MARIEGADWSHWQGVVDCAKGYAMGLRFVGIKVSQGINYKDDKAEINNDCAQANGYKTFPYHFVTIDNAITQFNWFVTCIGNMKFDLPPALDVEYYNSAPSMDVYGLPVDIIPIMEYRMEKPPLMYQVRLAANYKLTIPSESTVWGIASRLRGFQGHAVPAIYTNPSSGNAVFKTGTFKWWEYLLWDASWTTGTPLVPNAWKGKPIYIWQDRVIRGAQAYGVKGDMDHDYWMDAMPFPGETPPVTPVTAEVYVRELNRNILLQERC